MIYDTIIGIDPGKSNGYIAIYRNGQIEVVKMHQSAIEFRRFIQHYKSISKRMIVYIELIDFHSMGNPAIIRQLKKLTDHYAELKLILKIEMINTRQLHPKKWQAAFGLIVKGVKGTEKKKMHRDFLVKKLGYPQVAVNKADAILILKYGISQIKSNIDLSNILIMKSC